MTVEQEPNEHLGAVHIAKEVLATIISRTALEVPGVARLNQPRLGWTRLFSHDSIPASGMSLTVQADTVSVDLYIVVQSGVNMLQVGLRLQDDIQSAIEHMIGMIVKEINIFIQDVE